MNKKFNLLYLFIEACFVSCTSSIRFEFKTYENQELPFLISFFLFHVKQDIHPNPIKVKPCTAQQHSMDLHVGIKRPLEQQYGKNVLVSSKVSILNNLLSKSMKIIFLLTIFKPFSVIFFHIKKKMWTWWYMVHSSPFQQNLVQLYNVCWYRRPTFPRDC